MDFHGSSGNIHHNLPSSSSNLYRQKQNLSGVCERERENVRLNDKWIESKIDMLIYRLYIDRVRDRETEGKRERKAWRHGDRVTDRQQIDIQTYRQTTRKKFKTERKNECCR